MLSANLDLVQRLLLILLRTAIPTVLFYFAVVYFFEEGGWALGLWILLVLLWLVFWIFVEQMRKTGRDEWQMQLRQVLASVRRITNDTTARLFEARARGLAGVEAMEAGHDRASVMREILYSIFLVASRGNVDLENHIRVTFMEEEHGELHIKYFANTENKAPVTMLENKSFRKGEGIAGAAWERDQTIIVPDVPAHVEFDLPPKFVAKTDQHKRANVKSMVSIPVNMDDPVKPETTFLGVLNIDSLEAGYFGNDYSEQRELEITIRPFLRLISQLYATHSVLSEGIGR